MRKVLFNILLGSVLVAWTGMLNAADTATPPKKEAPKPQKMECEIVKVNADAKTIEVKDGDKTETLSLSKKCKVHINGAEKTLADLKPGDKCHCTCFDRKDGTKSVSEIVVGEDMPKAVKKKEPAK